MKSSRDADDPALGPTAESGEGLSEAEISMLELVEFGIDRWSSASSERAISSLVERGFVHREPEGRYTLTAEGSSVLQAAKTLLDENGPDGESDAVVSLPRRR